MTATPTTLNEIIDNAEPVFVFTRESDGCQLKVWANGKVEGFGPGIVMNSIPSALALAGTLDQQAAP